MTQHILSLELAERSYPIIVGDNLISEAGKYISDKISLKRIHIVTDENIVKAGYLQSLQTGLSKYGIESDFIILPAGESTKSFEKLQFLCDQLLTRRLERKSTLIALGGGVIGDITGFAASILLRGINFIQIPTTLLAMIDSSVGGKTGINTSFGKNLVGSFYQPKLVLADVATLATLPDQEIKAGYAEMVKYALIDDPEFFQKLDCQQQLYTVQDIVHCIKSKARIVAEDEKEGGKRALLNLGHTFGHAIEAETQYTIPHGYAVAIGMAMAFQYSAFVSICSERDAAVLVSHLTKRGLPVSAKDYGINFAPKKFLEHCRADKKVLDGKLTFILAKGIGKSFIANDVDEQSLLNFLITQL